MNRENEIINVRVDEIVPNRFQPRLAFDEAELKTLADSIKTHGIIQPLVLRRLGDKFEIIAGERRYKASVMAGLQTVPAVIMNLDDKQSAEVAVVENLQRKNLTAIEEAQSYKKILDMGYVTQEELASRMGVTQPTIANKLRLLNLTIPVKEALLKNQISERHARSLLQINDQSIQIAMLGRIINERLTVKQTDDEIAKILGKTINEVTAQTENIYDRPITETIQNIPTQQTIEDTNGEDTSGNQNITLENKPFDVDIDKIKNESEDIIKEHIPTDISMLLRKENEPQEEQKTKISLEDTPTNIDMGSIATPKEVAINPFQEITPEIMEFEVPSQEIKQETPQNSLIEEFRTTHHPETIIPPTIEEPTQKGIAQAINLARDEIRKIENLGFNVDTEEFDFEDMYQIIIKIKKD